MHLDLLHVLGSSSFGSCQSASAKIKKSEHTSTLLLEKTNDILAWIGAAKNPQQTIVGFALETENEETNALKKMQKKKTDFIVLNSLKDEGAGFGLDTNQVTIYAATGERKVVQMQSKMEVAKEIIEFVLI
jgi:phosphopantothenoylcysteine decarboxylase/phosphopantothenate--cysteine ligase